MDLQLNIVCLIDSLQFILICLVGYKLDHKLMSLYSETPPNGQPSIKDTPL